MNIKTLRKNYENLTMLERLSLADNAESRNDENEIRAINAASPKELFKQVDYYDLMKQITIFRLCNLIVRLSYIMNFDYFSTLAELEILKNKSSSNRYEKYLNDAAMSAFLYCRATDSWQILNDELGLRPNFDEEISEFLFSYDLLKNKENIMRKLALSENEAREEIKNQFGVAKIQTLEDEIEAIRKALNLPPK